MLEVPPPFIPKDTPEPTGEPSCSSRLRDAPVTVQRFTLHESNRLRPRFVWGKWWWHHDQAYKPSSSR